MWHMNKSYNPWHQNYTELLNYWKYTFYCGYVATPGTVKFTTSMIPKHLLTKNKTYEDLTEKATSSAQRFALLKV